MVVVVVAVVIVVVVALAALLLEHDPTCDIRESLRVGQG